MKIRIKYFLIPLFILTAGAARAQNALKEQLKYADGFYKSGAYFDAVTEYKRLLYFDVKGEYADTANYMIGLCYKAGGRFSDAILYFTNAEIKARTEDRLYRAKLEVIRSNILRRTTHRALELLDSMAAKKKYAPHLKNINYWRGWSYVFGDEWGKAASAFRSADSAENIAALCDSINAERYPVSFIKLMSYVIPGSGQIYTGHYASGLLSLGWNLLWGYTAVNAFAADRIFDGLMVTNFLWLRFYNGNLQNAGKFAVEENIKISNGALDYLQKRFKGLKP